ncbi:MAG: NAD(P)-dependent oxidoreductase [Myxococcota bacterium]|nr:NAD(P)-dependent oxidoreductase [Myxococcota bacterium]
MRIAVTGGSSFVGAHFCRLASTRHQVIPLYHSTPTVLNGTTPLRCDLRSQRDMARLRELAPELIVHLACRIKAPPIGDETPSEAARNINRAMLDAVLSLEKPLVYASSTVVHWEGDSPYALGRREDEKRVGSSGLPYAIVRPCAPYGPRLVGHQPGHKESFHLLARLVRSLPAIPVVGDGRYRRQPVHVDDFARSILSLIDQGLPSQSFDAGGAEELTFDEVVDTLAKVMGRRVNKIHIPKQLFVRLARIAPDFDPELMDTMDCDDVADPSLLAAAAGFMPRSFSEGVRCLI